MGPIGRCISLGLIDRSWSNRQVGQGDHVRVNAQAGVHVEGLHSSCIKTLTAASVPGSFSVSGAVAEPVTPCQEMKVLSYTGLGVIHRCLLRWQAPVVNRELEAGAVPGQGTVCPAAANGQLQMVVTRYPHLLAGCQGQQAQQGDSKQRASHP